MRRTFGWARGRGTVVVIAGLVGSLILPLGTGTASAAEPGQTGLLNSSLAGVSCPTTTFCMVVGSFNAAGLASTYFTFGEQWNGSSWSLTPTVTPPDLGGGALLNAVSCASATSCMAVGEILDFHLLSGFTYQPLAERWNGVVWKAVPTAKLVNAGAVLDGIDCFLAKKCFAVGSTGTPGDPAQATLAESWNGTKWTTMTTPALSQTSAAALNQVSCATASACQAVGYASGTGPSTPLDESWDGTSWTQVTTPALGTSGSFSGVSCSSATACTAVGTQGTGSSQAGLAEGYNGVVWKVQRVPGPSGSSSTGLTQVSCSTAASCMASGVSQGPSGQAPLSVQSNGAHWTDVLTPDPGAVGELLSVSCASLSVCVSVGNETGLGNELPLAEGWDGVVWQVLSVLLPLNSRR